jgi:peptidoglycan/xylan/chitin deacetylase (PgdA/CDA1 family)
VGWKHTALAAVRRLGGLRLLESFYGRSRITVLAYHRVADPDAPGFVGFRGNASATLAEFEHQMDWVAERMNPITLDELAASLDGRNLPDRSVVVTFDDGYRDNLTAAAPALERRGIPATIFLATDHIGTSNPFWWDRAAWHFHSHGPGSARLPILGDRRWSDTAAMAAEWVAGAKRVPDAERVAALDRLGDVLGGDVGSAFAGTLLGWDDVGALVDRGWAIGAHTRRHPILTRLSDPEAVRAEVSGSVERVRQETGTDVLGFAYPNGQREDFDDVAMRAVADAGVPLAFSLVAGPARPAEVRDDPLAVRRIYVHHGDDPVRFSAKVSGVSRIVGRT